MNGSLVPEQDHVVRYCKPKQIDAGKIQPSAFILRENEKSLSVNWLEKLCRTNRSEQIEALRNIFRQKAFNVKTNARFAVLNVGNIRNKVRTETVDHRELKLTHEPSENDQSHSGIYNLHPDNMLIAELIIETIHEDYPARQ